VAGTLYDTGSRPMKSVGGAYANKQYRVCFTWTDAGPRDVEFLDYHN
jgi:plasmid maintenance system killer protein